MKRILCIILAFSMVFALAGCKSGDDALEEVTVVLDWTPNTNHAGLYVAQKMGYYEDLGLKVNIIQPPEGGAEALVAAGRAEFGISFQDSMAPALCEGLDIIAIAAICQHNLSGIISKKDKGIDSFSKLEGRSYATWGSPIEQSIIGYCMEKDGGNIEDLNMIDSTVTDVLTALETDMIDSVWVYEYWDVMKAQIEGYDYNYLDFKSVDETMDYYTPVIISNGTYADGEGYEIAEGFIMATKMGYKFASENPREAAEILLEADKTLDRELVIKSQEFMADKYTDEDGYWGYIDRERWNRFYNWLYEKGLIEKDLTDKGFTMWVLDN
ncbi:MAG: ABC transporter substrate-binding protein [Clostridia bacterium]|nr:ABC transporter substrate-binding protein [Clostridia bacterium]